MATLEQVEKLRQYANVSYEKAKEALDACGDDILDAIVYLEKQGTVPPPQTGSGEYTTQRPMSPAMPPSPHPPKQETISDLIRRFWRWILKWIRNLCTNLIVVKRKGNDFFSVPIVLFIVALCAAFWPTVVIFVISLFFGFTYSFRGKDISDDSNVNNLMGNVSKTAEDIKNGIKHSTNHHDKE